MPPRRISLRRAAPLAPTSADVERRKGDFPLAYTPHPATNRYPSLFPKHLADAPKRTHTIQFAHLVEMHDVLTEIEAMLVRLNPRCVLFFATGGYPVVFPLLERLRQAGRHHLLDGRVFHMFPGLSWERAIDGLRPEPYLARELEPILRGPSPTGGDAIVAIDTTNSGNAVNLAVKAIHAACERAALVDSEIHVLGIVNGEKADKEDSAERMLLRSAADPNRGVYVLAPSGFAPTGDVVSGTLTEFVSKPGGLLSIRIAYWLVDKLFTEDVLDLIGAAAIRDKLGVKSAGRLVIRYNEKVATRETGYGTIATRLMALLSASRDSGKWALLERNHEYAQNPVKDEELLRAANESTRMAFRILELNRDPAAAIEHIVGKASGLPDGDTVRWMADHLPAAVKAAPKVLAAIRKADADDWLIEAALVFLHRAYSEIAATGPPIPDQRQACEWWIGRLGKPQEG